MITIACVLKSGGDYDWKYVEKLYKGVQKNLSYDFTFTIITDIPIDQTGCGIDFVNNTIIIPLTLNLPGYWSKIELFQLKGSVIYFDLDTIILNSIDRLARELLLFESAGLSMFYMLEAFSSRKWATGILAWHGDFSWIYSNFVEEDYQKEKWEVDYVLKALEEKSFINNIMIIQEHIDGKIYSYKHHCKEGIPNDAGIICFHGKPRPREVGWLEKEYSAKK